jgi:hypothetical protein
MKLLLFSLLSSAAIAGRFRRTKQDYKLKLNNHLNVQYSGDFTIGGQPLPVIYDTGSFEVLVLSRHCNSVPSNLKVYDSSTSKSFESLHMEANHAFASGDVVAMEGYEDLQVGDPDSTAGVKHFPFWEIKSHELKFWHTGNAIFSGIVGLSHGAKIPNGFGGDPNHDDALLEHLSLTAFALCFERGPVGAAPAGWLTFGNSIENLKSDAHVWQSVSVTGNNHWSTSLTGFSVDLLGLDTSNLCRSSCEALFDSGSSLLALPRSAGNVVQALKDLVKPDCSNIASLPTLRFKFNGAEVSLPPKAYIFQVNGENGGQVCKAAFFDMGSSQYAESFVFGMPFMRYYVTVFDKVQKQMHFARVHEDCSPAEKTAILTSSSVSVASAEKSAGVSMAAGMTSRDYSEPTTASLDDILIPAFARKAATGDN